MTNKGKRHTFEKNDLLDSIIKMRLQGHKSRTSIRKFLMDELGYSSSYAYELIREASEEFDSRTIQNFGRELKEDIERFELLLEANYKAGNLREARENLKEIAKLKGHYKERIELSGEITYKAKFDDV